MYKTVIADDEPHVVEGLKLMFDWTGSGFEIVGTASNGIEAYEKIMGLRSDLAIIDIRMPGCDGLELSKRLRESGYDGGIIILTGYAEIDYAREGIKYGVKYFLDKPVDNDELKNTLADFKKEFDRLNRRKSVVSDAAERNSVIKHGDYNKWCVMSIRLKNPIAVSDLPDGVRLYEHSLGVQSYVIGDGSNIESVAKRFFDRILRNNPKAIAYAAYCDGENDIKSCYRTAVDSLMRIVKPVPGTLYTAKEHKEKVASPVAFSEFVKQLTDSMEFGDVEAVKQCIDAFFYMAATEPDPMVYAQMLYSYVDMYANSAAANADSDAVKGAVSGHVMVGLSDYHKRISDICAEIVNKTAETEGSGKERIFDMVERYLEEHFREDIVIKDIAAAMYTSPGYLGAIFTKEKGMSIKDYIHTMRMNEAERLMKSTDKTISDIAYEVGYNNYNHFYTQFERRFGMTPAAYRKKLRK